MPRPIPKLTKRNFEALDKRLQALELRKKGWTYREIADSGLYETPSGAYKAVQDAMRLTVQEPSEEVRMLELHRLDALLGELWGKATDGDLYAIDRALKIMERRAKLLGLDMVENDTSAKLEEMRLIIMKVSDPLLKGMPEKQLPTTIESVEEHDDVVEGDITDSSTYASTPLHSGVVTPARTNPTLEEVLNEADSDE